MFQMGQIGAVICLFVMVCTAVAGPFGLEKGMTLQQIGGNPQKVAPGKYQITAVPKPYSAFEKYIVEVAPHSGLCWIKGVGKDVQTSVYGFELRTAFESLKGRLDDTYGTARVLDSVLPGSIWNEPGDWMMGLIKKERNLFALWNRGTGAKLPPDINAIGLMAAAKNTDSGFVMLEYAFDNEGECEAELARVEGAGQR